MTGTHYKTLVLTQLPVVGFRDANEGTELTKARYENRLVQSFFMNPRWAVDVMAADSSEDGVAVLMGLQGAAHLQAAFQKVCSQFYYGRDSGDAKGFPGLLSALDSNMVVDATGTTESTCSSVWGVSWGPQRVQWVYGGGGKFKMPDVSIRDVEDADGKKFSAYFQEMFAHVGLQVMNKYSISRIKKLTEDSGKGLTDDLVARLIEKHPIGYKPDVLFCSRRSLRQLQDSRTATNSTGAPAPFPTESHGIPILPTDSILDTETLAL